jgi:YD repeat-containing protein
MKTVYDPHTDTLTITLAPGPVHESDEDKPGTILDYDSDGNLIRIEILDASRRLPDFRSMHFEVAA